MSSTIEQFLSNSYDRIERICDRFVQRQYWRIELSLICLGLVFFSATPYLYNLDLSNGSAWDVVKLQIDDPTRQYELDNPDSHSSKHTFRLTVPLLSKVLGLQSTWSIYFMQVIFVLFFFRLLVRFSDRLTVNSLIKVILPIAFCFIAIGQAGVFDVYGRFDSFSLFFLLTAMVFRSPFIIFSAVLLGGFTDERAFIATPMVILWWQVFEQGQDSFTLSNLMKLNSRALAALLGMFGYLLLRFYLIDAMDLLPRLVPLEYPSYYASTTCTCLVCGLHLRDSGS